MKNWFHRVDWESTLVTVGGFALVVAMVLTVIGIFMLCFAFMGWILLSFINIFGAGVVITFWTSFIFALGLSITIAIIKTLID